MWACQQETKGYTGANCGGRIRTDFPNLQVIVFLHVLFCRDSEDFPDSCGRTGKESSFATPGRTLCLCLLSTVFTSALLCVTPQYAAPALLDL